uniref:Obscurin like cytoskeletal adaptor 1 n=1 Tax=Leptobrachium leishanense TaxID=445787 RepID=A0A8C5QTT9_9ANUR
MLSPSLGWLRGAPRFLSFPRSITAPVGSQAVLRCRISGDPPPCVLWERVGNIRLELGNRCHVLHDGDWYQLVIGDLRLEDSGHYMCRASNWSGEGYAGAKLMVTPNFNEVNEPAEYSEIPDFPPHFLLVPMSQRLCRGQNAELSCRLSGKPEPTIQWDKDGVSLEDLCDGSHYRLSPDGQNLYISNVHAPDAGVYVCRAKNTVGQCLAAAVLLVDPLPRQGQEPALGDPPPQVKVFTVNEGKHAKLRCLVTGKPRPEIIWRKDSRAVSPGRRTLIYEDREGHFTLKVLFCRQQDRGLYVCGASNTAGNTLSAVMLHVREVGERFPAPLRDVAVREGQDAVLECSVPDGSRTTWYLEDQRLHPGKRHHMEEHGPLRRLIIRGARTDDDGVYVCQTQRGAQSIAEVAVRGSILKRLPRRLEVGEGGNAAFCAETDSDMEQVGWTHHGEILSEDSRTVLKSFGRTHVLVLVGVTQDDSGIIQFHAGLSESSCQLRVKGVFAINCFIIFYVNTSFKFVFFPEPPVKLVNKSNDAQHSCLSGQSVTLSCEVSRVNALVRWYRDGEEVAESENIKLESEGRHRRLIILNAKAQDPSNARVGPAFYVVYIVSFSVIPEAPVKIVNTSDDAELRCLSGEPVVLGCELSRENAHVRWYRDGEEVEENEHIRVESEGRHRRLVITSAQAQDSGEYVCDASNDSVFFNVTIKDPPVKIVNTSDDAEHQCLNGEHVVLSCEVSRENAQVRWYHDGVEVEESESIVMESEGRHRRLVIHNAQALNSGEYVCDAGDDSIFYNLTVTGLSWVVSVGCLTGENVTLLCEVSRENAQVRWYRDGVEVEDGEDIKPESDGMLRRLIINATSTELSGEYVCDARDASATYHVTVTEPLVQIMNAGEDTEKRCLSGEEVVLSCELSRQNALVRWYRDGERVEESERITLESDGRFRRLVILSAQTLDSGEFVCDAGDDSTFYNVTVKGLPTRIKHPSCVELSCELSRENAPVIWYKDGEEVGESEDVIIRASGRHRKLIIPVAQAQDSGEYVCDARDDSVFYNVSVTDPPVRIENTTDDTAHKSMSGERVLLSCEVSRENAAVRWYKDGVEVEESESVRLESDGKQRQLIIDSAQLGDSGEYECDAGDDSLVYYLTVTVTGGKNNEWKGSPPVVIVQNSTVLEGETATFKCVVSPDDVNVLWEVNGSSIHSDNRARLSSNGLCHSLTLHSCRISDSGTVTANAEGIISRARLRVQEAHVLFSEGLQDVEVEEEQDVTLKVKATTEKADVRWTKQGVVIQSSDKFSVQSSDRTHSLTIHCVQPADRGRYSCESLHDRTDCRLNVLPRSISIKKGLQDVKCVEGSNVEFSVELSHEGLIGEWWKGGVRLTSDDHCMITASGRQHFLRFYDLTCPDSGVIAFTSDTLRSTAQLTVTEHPLAITHPPQDFVVNEGGLSAFQCEVSKLEAVVTWSKVRSAGILSVILEYLQYVLSANGSSAVSSHFHMEHLSFSSPAEQEPMVVKDLQDVDITENENAVFTCEMSCSQAKGEWYKNGEEIRVTSTTKIRQEGISNALQSAFHFCLSTLSTHLFLPDITLSKSRKSFTVTALPVRIMKALRDKTVLEGHRVTLECKVNPPRAQVTWLKGHREIVPSSKYQIYNEDAFRKLVISDVSFDDEDLYTVKTKGGQSTARVLVEGKNQVKASYFSLHSGADMPHKDTPAFTYPTVRVEPY